MIIINNAKDHQIKYKLIYKNDFNLSLHERDQPQPLVTIQLIHQLKHTK